MLLVDTPNYLKRSKGIEALALVDAKTVAVAFADQGKQRFGIPGTRTAGGMQGKDLPVLGKMASGKLHELRIVRSESDSACKTDQLIRGKVGIGMSHGVNQSHLPRARDCLNQTLGIPVVGGSLDDCDFHKELLLSRFSPYNDVSP